MTPNNGTPHGELVDLTVDEMRQLLDAGELTSVRLAELHLARIEAVDQKGPRLGSIIELNSRAVDIAASLDSKHPSGHQAGRLRGIPILVKDNIETGDAMLTTAGSLALVGPPAASDALLVGELRRAGAVLLGKANLSEWANFRSTQSTSGWSARGGQTLNPHVLDRSPSGSSSGSAVAVAAGLVPIAIGTETDGSIISPSAACGIVGFKPTVGSISRTGIIPISGSQDTAGCHGRTVADVAALYDCLSLKPKPTKLDTGALRGKRIGALREPFTGYSQHADLIYESALGALRDAGAVLVEGVFIETAPELRSSDVEGTILLHEFKAGINAYLSSRTGIDLASLEDLIEFNRIHAEVEMPYFGQERFEKAQKTDGLEAAVYREAVAQAIQMSRIRGIDATLLEHRLDALAAPSGSPAWVIDYINGDRSTGSACQPAAVAGYPHITVPAGLAIGALPVGLSLFAGPDSDSDLIAMAYAFEQVTRARRAPRFMPTLHLGR